MGHQVGCYLSFAQVEQLDDLAHAAGTSRSALIRDVIADFLNEPSTEIKDLRVYKLDCTGIEFDAFTRQPGTFIPVYAAENKSNVPDLSDADEVNERRVGSSAI